jgi:hypothetical protein
MDMIYGVMRNLGIEQPVPPLACLQPTGRIRPHEQPAMAGGKPIPGYPTSAVVDGLFLWSSMAFRRDSMSTKTAVAILLVTLSAGQAYGYGYHVWGYEVYPAYPVYGYPPPVVYTPPPVVVAPPPVVEVLYPPPVVYHLERGRVKIDTLRARGHWQLGGLNVAVRYKVKFRRMPVDNQELHIRFLDHGRVVVDTEGNPIGLVVPLDAPSRVGRREIKFEGTTSVFLPTGSFLSTKRLRVDARVVDRPSGTTLIQKDRSVR